jgi:hypothetical protein
VNYQLLLQSVTSVTLRLLPEHEATETITNLQTSNMLIKKKTVFETKVKVRSFLHFIRDIFPFS